MEERNESWVWGLMLQGPVMMARGGGCTVGVLGSRPWGCDMLGRCGGVRG